MSALLDDEGLKLSGVDPALAAILGTEAGQEGAAVLTEAVTRSRTQVQLRDWLYCLARTPGSWVRRLFLDKSGKHPDQFIDLIEQSMDDEPAGVTPLRLTQATAAPAVIAMLDRAESMARDHGAPVSDAILTLAILETADEILREALTAWATEDGMKSLLARLRGELAGPRICPPLFEKAILNPRAFAPAGAKLCRRLTEDACSLGARKVTTRHLLYTLLGNDAGVLSIALGLRGVDVKKELHAPLSRELTRGGRKRGEPLILGEETLFEAVRIVLKHSQELALERGATAVNETDVARAFVTKQPGEIRRLFPQDKPIDVAGLQAALQDLEPDEDAEPPVRRLTIAEMQTKIKQRIIGQDVAVDRVIPWIKRLRFGLTRDNRPAAVLLFLGPTGAGKTQLAKELAQHVFGGDEQLIFLEMGQFKTKESMSGLIGAPPGYIGYGEGKLTNGLRDRPECVVLFDEIEKADTQVFDTVLRFADEGMISDPAGPVRDGRKCIIVMTTNAGQSWLRTHLAANPGAREDTRTLSSQLFDEAMKELSVRGFRPEFLGRVDERICFLPFTIATCRGIVDQVLQREVKKLEERGVTLEVDDEARQVLAQRAYDRSLDEGARGAPRAVNELIVTPAIDLVTDRESPDGELAVKHLVATRRGLNDVVLSVEA